MQWVLLIALTANDPGGLEITRFATEERCQQAAMKIWLTADRAARERRGDDQAADVYGICRSTADTKQLP